MQQTIDDRIYDLGNKIFGNLGTKEFISMLVKQSTKFTNNYLDEKYPKVAPKNSKKKND